MKVTETFYPAARAEWRGWLSQHHTSAKEIWLEFFRKGSGKPSISYNDAVEEALCFGWIDSTRKSLDGERYAQRFSPRRAGSGYSQPNIERLRSLAARGLVQPDVLASVTELLGAPFEYPADIEAALRANAQAWQNFQRYSEPYRRIRIAFVDSVRNRPDEFDKRLRHLIRKTEANCQFGYGIEQFFE